jgi:hypothetical protein
LSRRQQHPGSLRHVHAPAAGCGASAPARIRPLPRLRRYVLPSSVWIVMPLAAVVALIDKAALHLP